jgi:mono/diheme cytochrome c family protein
MVTALVFVLLLPLQPPANAAATTPTTKAATSPAKPKSPTRPAAPTTPPTTTPTTTWTPPITWPALPGPAAPVTATSTLTVVVPAVPVPPPRPVAPAKVLAQGRKLYQQRCSVCHGDTGAADGVGARRLVPEPQHLDAVIWQANVTDDEIAKAILLGGAAVSRSPMMPANPDLKTKPAVVQSLVAYVRQLRAPFGSALGSLALADKSSRAAHGAATRDGTATLVFRDVPRGKAQLTVMVDGDGTVRCTLDVDVQQDTTLSCASASTSSAAPTLTAP